MAQRSVEAKLLEAKDAIKNCEFNSKTSTDEFVVYNNLWGKSRIDSSNASLCTFHLNGTAGWEWQMPHDAKGVIGYPAIMLGNGPWKVEKKTHGFPVRLDSIRTLKVDYATEIYVKGNKYNLAFDVWLSSEFGSRPETVTTEIMVWEDYNDFRSFGKKVDVLQTDFGEYAVMKGYLKNAEFGQDWHYFAFVRKVKRQSGSVDLQYFLNYLVQHHGVSSHHFVTSVEFGNEIGNSSGFTLVKKFDWVLE